MAYTPLGFRPVNAAPDTTGFNPGNWTASLTPNVIQVSEPVFEVYHLYIRSPQITNGFTFADVLIDLGYWDTTLIAQRNSWDPAQPMLMTPGNTLNILFNVPVTTTPAPFVTAWFRYEH